MKRVLIAMLVCGVVLVVAYFVIGIAPFDTGRYATGFSEHKFESVQIGMRKTEAIRILGQPLVVDEVLIRRRMLFGVTADPARSFLENCAGPSDNCWIAVFSKDGRTIAKVIGKPPAEDIGGITYSALLERFGYPVAYDPTKLTRLSYGESGTKYGYYRDRSLGLDQDGHVAEKWSRTIWH
jgi:hypothetical protein